MFSDKNLCRTLLCHCHLSLISSVFCKLPQYCLFSGSALQNYIEYFVVKSYQSFPKSLLTFRVFLCKNTHSLVRQMMAHTSCLGGKSTSDVHLSHLVKLVSVQCLHLEVAISPLILVFFFFPLLGKSYCYDKSCSSSDIHLLAWTCT